MYIQPTGAGALPGRCGGGSGGRGVVGGPAGEGTGLQAPHIVIWWPTDVQSAAATLGPPRRQDQLDQLPPGVGQVTGISATFRHDCELPAHDPAGPGADTGARSTRCTTRRLGMKQEQPGQHGARIATSAPSFTPASTAPDKPKPRPARSDSERSGIRGAPELMLPRERENRLCQSFVVYVERVHLVRPLPVGVHRKGEHEPPHGGPLPRHVQTLQGPKTLDLCRACSIFTAVIMDYAPVQPAVLEYDS